MQIVSKNEYYTTIELQIDNELIESGNYIVSEVNSKLSKVYGEEIYMDLESLIIDCLEQSDLNHYPDLVIERKFTELDEFEKDYL